MVGIVRFTRLETRTARMRLPRQREPFWRSLVAGRAHLGWQQSPKGSSAPGKWLLRRYIDGKYSQTSIGTADDLNAADGDSVLDFEQAERKARAMLDRPAALPGRYTVRACVQDYCQYLMAHGKETRDVASRLTAHVLPVLGDCAVADLTAERLTKWRMVLSDLPAMRHTAAGKPQAYKPKPKTAEEIRKRRASANRTLSVLRAALNRAYRDGRVASDREWRRVEPFKGVHLPKSRFLSLEECTRLLNAADPAFRQMVRAGLETGARYSELCALTVADYHGDSGSLTIRRSKTGRTRHIILSHEGAEWFAQVALGRAGGETMFVRADGRPWTPSAQARPMMEACDRAHISPRISFHGLRHTHASLSIMAGRPLMVVAQSLGHSNTRMVESVYGHLSAGFVTEQVRKHAPKFGNGGEERKILPLR